MTTATSTQEHDLATFNGWWEKAVDLLQDKAPGTALVDEACRGFVLMMDGEVCCLSALPGENMKAPAGKYLESEASCVDPRAWSGDAWSDMSAQDTQKSLLQPVFVKLNVQKESLPSTPKNLREQLAKIEQQPQRQDGTNDQLRDLHGFAVRLGLYDAADLIKTLVARR